MLWLSGALWLADEGSLKPPLPSSGETEDGATPMAFWKQYVLVQSQMFGAHGSMSEHSYGSRPQQWILLQKTLPYWLDSASNVSCSRCLAWSEVPC